MDNPNNPNPSANPNPTSPLGGSIPTPIQPETTPTQPQSPAEPGPMPPPPPPPPFPSPTPSWPPASEPTIPSTEPTPLPVAPPAWPQENTTQTNLGTSPSVPGSIGPDLSSAWTPPVPAQPEPAQIPTQSEPTVSNPWSNPQPSIDPLSSQQNSAWTPPAPSEPGSISKLQTQTPTQPEPNLPLAGPAPAQSEPTPTFTPPVSNPLGGTSEPSSVTSSPLNNPWGTTPANPTQPSWMATPTDTAPTDLSHLISNNQQESTPLPTAESMIAPSAGVITPEVPNLPTETHKGIPKWLIGLGIGLLIIVLGASAYFILGIGQSKGTTSLPATTTPQTNQVKPPLPIATPSAHPATGSANFGQLGGGNGGTQATSAADLIRQRQQGR